MSKWKASAWLHCSPKSLALVESSLVVTSLTWGSKPLKVNGTGDPSRKSALLPCCVTSWGEETEHLTEGLLGSCACWTLLSHLQVCRAQTVRVHWVALPAFWWQKASEKTFCKRVSWDCSCPTSLWLWLSSAFEKCEHFRILFLIWKCHVFCVWTVTLVLFALPIMFSSTWPNKHTF